MADKSPAEVLADQLNKTGEEEEGTTPDSGDSNAVAAASEEASQAADVETQESASEEVEQEPTGRSPKLQKILDKYNGDEDLAADSIYESWNSTSKLRKDIEELKTHLMEKDKKAPSFEADPDIQGLQSEITALDQELKFNDDQRRGLIGEIDQARTEVAVLEGQLRLADEFQKPQLEQRKMLAERELKTLARQWAGLSNSDARLNREKSGLGRQLRSAQNYLQAIEAQRQHQQTQGQAVQKEILKDFVTEVVDLASASGIEDDSIVEHMISALKAEAHLYLSGMPENAPGIDIPAFVQARGQAYLKAMGVLKTKNFSAHSASKAALSRTTAGKTPQTPPSNGKVPGKTFAPKTAQEAKAWAAAKLAEISRAGAS